jgi:hypothetical protein
MTAATAAPTLNISRSGNQLTLSWSQTGFVLEENSSITNSASWTMVAGGNTSPVTITLPTTGNDYYRLRKL